MIILNGNRRSNITRVRNATRQWSTLVNRINESLPCIFKRIINFAINYIWLSFTNISTFNFFAIWANQSKSIKFTFLPIATGQDFTCAKSNIAVSIIAIHNRIQLFAITTFVRNIKVQATFTIIGCSHRGYNIIAHSCNAATYARKILCNLIFISANIINLNFKFSSFIGTTNRSRHLLFNTITTKLEDEVVARAPVIEVFLYFNLNLATHAISICEVSFLRFILHNRASITGLSCSITTCCRFGDLII